VRIFWPANVYRATSTAPFIRAAFPILLFLEDRKHLGEGPPLGSILRPPVVVPLHATHPHHGIDAGAATKYVAEGHIKFAIIQSRRWVNRKVVVERASNVVKPDTWIRDGRSVVGSSRLDEEYLRA